ncbi:MAG: rhodanese-like domain-containing protein [Acidobacteria bacterium]|nr:rhodanese-like domain-containing protein [Acidobacteriota bacterium]
MILYVGFGFLYRSAHLPGALFHGPAAKPDGLEDLKKWAKDIPRGQPIVIYCGCCPWNRCPNVRPAFTALHELGFVRLKVLFLETDLATNWVQKGFPVEKGT